LEAWKRAATIQFDAEMKQEQEALLARVMRRWTPEKQKIETEIASVSKSVEEKRRLRDQLKVELVSLSAKQREMSQLIETERAGAAVEVRKRTGDYQMEAERQRKALERKTAPVFQQIETLEKRIEEQQQYIRYFEANQESRLAAEKAGFESQTKHIEQVLQSAIEQRQRASDQLKMLLSTIEREREMQEVFS
jgi:predicted  nucleic acid-binding Zn-ribbon protein